jgi:hypothetical protein
MRKKLFFVRKKLFFVRKKLLLSSHYARVEKLLKKLSKLPGKSHLFGSFGWLFKCLGRAFALVFSTAWDEGRRGKR